jgi:hypothetical protein
LENAIRSVELHVPELLPLKKYTGVSIAVTFSLYVNEYENGVATWKVSVALRVGVVIIVPLITYLLRFREGGFNYFFLGFWLFLRRFLSHE